VGSTNGGTNGACMLHKYGNPSTGPRARAFGKLPGTKEREDKQKKSSGGEADRDQLLIEGGWAPKVYYQSRASTTFVN